MNCLAAGQHHMRLFFETPPPPPPMYHQLSKTRFASAELTSGILVITPELAKEMLSASRGNRKIRQKRVNDWARALAANSWEVITDDIGFDVDGYLINGHHRLHACAQSGVPFKCGIKQGLSKTAYQKMDCGLARAIHERSSLGKKHVEVLRLASEYLLGIQRPSIADLEAVAQTGLLNASEALLDCCGQSVRFFSSAPLRFAACAHIVHNKSERHVEYVMATYRGLMHVSGCDLSPIADALVRQFIRGDVSSRDRVDTILRGLRVFNYEKRSNQKIPLKDISQTALVAEIAQLLDFHAT